MALVDFIPPSHLLQKPAASGPSRTFSLPIHSPPTQPASPASQPADQPTAPLVTPRSPPNRSHVFATALRSPQSWSVPSSLVGGRVRSCPTPLQKADARPRSLFPSSSRPPPSSTSRRPSSPTCSTRACSAATRTRRTPPPRPAPPPPPPAAASPRPSGPSPPGPGRPTTARTRTPSTTTRRTTAGGPRTGVRSPSLWCVPVSSPQRLVSRAPS